MDTGKVEFAPDYKSDKGTVSLHVGDGWTDGVNVVIDGKPVNGAEHQQLRDAVIEAAKAEFALFRSPIDNVSQWSSGLSLAQVSLRRAVDALITFEREHGLNQP